MSLIKCSPVASIGGVYDIPNSGAFAAEDNTKMTRTLGSGNSKVFTLSTIFKRVDINTYFGLLGSNLSNNGQDDAFLIRGDDNRLSLFGNGAVSVDVRSNMVFRDTTAFYHVVIAVDTTQAVASNRVRMYANGVALDTKAGSIQPPQDYSFLDMNNSVSHYIGDAFLDATSGYMSEIHFIDGQALTPDNFGELDPTTNQWVAKKYTGSYGANGFYLDFQNGANLGEDKSGNGNDFTNSGVTQSTDTPTDNHCIMNNLTGNTAVIKQSGLFLDQSGFSSSTNQPPAGTIGMQSGKFYWEVTHLNSSQNALLVGMTDRAMPKTGTTFPDNAGDNTIGYYGHNGNYREELINVAYGDTFTTNDIIGVGVDIDASEITFFKNNASQGTKTFTLISESGSWFPVLINGSGSDGNDGEVRFAEDSWVYSAPAGYKAISTKNLSEPEIAFPEKYFKTITYNDGAGSKTIGFQPDLVWMKSRGSTYSHKLVDSTRGVTKGISSDSDAGETTDATGLTSFDSNGFTVGADTSYSDTAGQGMVAWCFKKKAGFFDVVSYAGTLSGTGTQSYSHNLGVPPELVIVCCLSNLKSNAVKCPSVGSVNHVAYLNLSNAFSDKSANGNMPADTDSLFWTNWTGGLNESGHNFIAYLFASVEGFSKIGSYVGNGNTDGPFINCGFKPAFVLIKSINSTGNWYLYDNARNTHNPNSSFIYANLTNAESTAELDLVSNGFKMRNTNASVNANGSNYIYLAIAEQPFKYSNAR